MPGRLQDVAGVASPRRVGGSKSLMGIPRLDATNRLSKDLWTWYILIFSRKLELQHSSAQHAEWNYYEGIDEMHVLGRRCVKQNWSVVKQCYQSEDRRPTWHNALVVKWHWMITLERRNNFVPRSSGWCVRALHFAGQLRTEVNLWCNQCVGKYWWIKASLKACTSIRNSLNGPCPW